jgi:chromosome segregation ATPase
VSKLEKRLEHECTIEVLRQRMQELENNAKSLRADKETLKHGLAQAHEELTKALKRVRELEETLQGGRM